MAELLPGEALRGVCVGISVSESPDLDRLGLLEMHFRLALGEITRAVMHAGGQIMYGGRLRPEGYTTFVLTEMQRYARRDRPLLVCLAWHEHRHLPLSVLEQFREELGLLGQLVCLDIDGVAVDAAAGRSETPEIIHDQRARQRALTGLRRYMCARQFGRVLIGGRRQEFHGALPGLVEEALMTLEAGQPIYLAGGFGGVTLDLIRELGIDSGDWLPRLEGGPPVEAGTVDGLSRVRALAAQHGWGGLNNGLTEQENKWLAASHRPGDIATLVSLGLGRLGQARATRNRTRPARPRPGRRTSSPPDGPDQSIGADIDRP